VGSVASTLRLYRNGDVGFIVWLDDFPIHPNLRAAETL
jgi:hypothetical protein